MCCSQSAQLIALSGFRRNRQPKMHHTILNQSSHTSLSKEFIKTTLDTNGLDLDHHCKLISYRLRRTNHVRRLESHTKSTLMSSNATIYKYYTVCSELKQLCSRSQSAHTQHRSSSLRSLGFFCCTRRLSRHYQLLFLSAFQISNGCCMCLFVLG